MRTIRPNKNIVIALIAIVLLAGCGHNTTESKTLTEFSDGSGNHFRGLYFYPSTIRMLVKVFSPEGSDGFSDIKKGRVFFSLSDENPDETAQLFKTLRKDVLAEGFEVLIEMKSPASNVHVYLKEGVTPDYVFFIRGDQGDLIVEINGELSKKTIQTIMKMDLSEAAQMLDLMPETVETDSINRQVESPPQVQ